MIESPQRKNKGGIQNSGFKVDTSESARIVRQLRRNWARRIAWRSFVFVGVPTILAIVYYAFWASDQYESVAIFALQGSEQGSPAHSDSVLGAPSGPTSNVRELLSIRDYMLSRTMFDAINRNDRWVRHYQSRKWDMLSRLSKHTTKEQAYGYFLSKVAVEYDSSSGNLTVRLRAFEPRLAKEFAEAIIENSESLLEELSSRMRKESLRIAEIQLAQAQDGLVLARRKLAMVQRGLPEKDAGNAEIDYDAKQFRGTSTGRHSLTLEPREDFDESNSRILVEVHFAEKIYESSISAISEIHANELQRRHLVIISNPSLPDYSTYPRRQASVATVFTFSFLAMGIGTLTVTAIREHARV